MLRNLFLFRRILRAPQPTSTCRRYLRRPTPHVPHPQQGRLYSTSQPESPPKHYIQHSIRTLNPAFVTQAEYVQFPEAQDHCYIWDAYATSTPLSTDTNDPSHRRPFSIVRASDTKQFPAGLGGYFYYYLPAGPVPPTAGEIRFRCVPFRSPEFFNQGHDFVADPDRGLPWHLPLTTIATRDSHQVFRNILLSDRLITPNILARAAEMGKALSKARTAGAKVPVLHSFGQPWYFDFETRVNWWHFMGVDKVHILRPMPNILTWKVGSDRTPSPWLGAALCVFKPDHLPTLRGRRVVRAKVLKILRPVAQNPEFPPELRYLVDAPAAVPPRAGDILHHGVPFWQFDVDGDNVDHARRAGFGALFANTGLPALRTERALRPRAPGVKEWERGRGVEVEEDEGWKRTLRSRVRK
ncbi:hypothetical protein GSI_08898 [Ganoderma sinense ZZ0214-1]|uniref:Uncharacterized protein n=1 Tax=Ganoderma sinense ZZ0214-1 TaxID=1077348 RepID=A0A2G8S505_9APHY|nr:hypothetical protein GSI_08898 [Ganoderma sinense ZZ0214-1]